MKILFIVLLIILSLKTFAQDNIIQTDGTEIKAKVLSVELDIITYKRFDNLEGPTYSILKSQVFMIQYENGTKDVFNKTTISPKTVPTPKHNPKKNSVIIVIDSLADYRVKSHIFINAGSRVGLFPTQYSSSTTDIKNLTRIGIQGGLDLEVGNVYYFVPKKMPLNFGVGLNFTWINTAITVGYPHFTYSSNSTSINFISFFPYTSSLGPQISYQPKKKLVLDLYVKPGVSLVYIDGFLKPAFIMDMGINFRYKFFMVGVNTMIMPTVTDIYEYKSGFQKVTLTNIPYNFSYFRIKIGVGIYAKK